MCKGEEMAEALHSHGRQLRGLALWSQQRLRGSQGQRTLFVHPGAPLQELVLRRGLWSERHLQNHDHDNNKDHNEYSNNDNNDNNNSNNNNNNNIIIKIII